MAATLKPKDNHNVEVHYVDSDVPYAIEEIGGPSYDPNDLDLSEYLLQESLYESLKGVTLRDANASSSSDSRVNPNLDQSRSAASSSLMPVSELQFTEDEMLARNLQELEDELVFSLSEFPEELNHATAVADIDSATAIVDVGSTSTGSSTGTSEMAVQEDGIDPDNMTYEELQSLGDAIGVESKGLPDDIISSLPTSRYKTGFFSRKGKNDQCVICCTPYEKREVLMTLPCNHYYHSDCISPWLKINKTCPVCNKQVFGS